MARNPCFMVEGEWSGYYTSQQRIVHRHYTRDPKEVETLRKMFAIYYTDGTSLRLIITEVSGRKRLPAINGYGDLIDECIRAGVNSVEALCAKQQTANT